MFAIFLSEKMDPFYDIVSSFPTVFYSAILLFAILYWCIAVLGLIEIDIFDIDTPDLDANSDSLSDLNVMAGLLIKLGLNGVPLTVVISFIALFGWVISFFSVHLLFPYIPTQVFTYLAGIGVLLGSLYVAARLTAVIIKPLRPLFLTSKQETKHSIIGQIATIRTGEANKTFGEAVVSDGGAGLIIKVRSYNDELFTRNDKVAIIEYDKDADAYKVISEAEFKNKL